MKYNREKIEAAKILFAEVLELDEKLPENKRVSASFHGGYHGFLSVDFLNATKKEFPKEQKTFRTVSVVPFMEARTPRTTLLQR